MSNSNLMIYWLIGVPIFTFIFVYFARKAYDIEVKVFLGMVTVACIPILREFILLMFIHELVKNKFKYEKFFSSVLFKKTKN